MTLTLAMLLVVMTALWLLACSQYAHQVEMNESLREQLAHARGQAHAAYVELSQCRLAYEALMKARPVFDATPFVWDDSQQEKRN